MGGRWVAMVALATALACGGGYDDDVYVPYDENGPTAGVPIDAQGPTGVAVPSSGGFTPPVAGKWPPTMRGACQMTFDCQCTEWSDVDACVATLGDGGVVEEYGGAACMVALDCASMCGGGGAACVKAAYEQKSTISRMGHETTMGIINNYPTGNCAAGQTRVTDQGGNFVRCE